MHTSDLGQLSQRQQVRGQVSPLSQGYLGQPAGCTRVKPRLQGIHEEQDTSDWLLLFSANWMLTSEKLITSRVY
jgi:hypothetical protein